MAIESGDEWSVVDLGDIIVHLISEAYRAKYNIEDFLDKLKKSNFKEGACRDRHGAASSHIF